MRCWINFRPNNILGVSWKWFFVLYLVSCLVRCENELGYRVQCPLSDVKLSLITAIVQLWARDYKTKTLSLGSVISMLRFPCCSVVNCNITIQVFAPCQLCFSIAFWPQGFTCFVNWKKLYKGSFICHLMFLIPRVWLMTGSHVYTSHRFGTTLCVQWFGLYLTWFFPF